MTDAFVYPQTRNRRHGPGGYAGYSSFRPWLRDEFSFRCVYCLIREEWGRLAGEYDLDHFQPRDKRSDLTNDYDNLVYACHTCNLRKSNHEVDDPESYLIQDFVRVCPDGRLEGLVPIATAIIARMGLNSPKFQKWRLLWIRNVELAKEYDPTQYQRLMGYPMELPDLAVLEPPTNSRPGGVQQSFHARKQRGELSDVYVD